MSEETVSEERLTAFVHLNAEKSTLYRAIMWVFVEAKSRFTLHLRPAEIVEALNSAGSLPELIDEPDVETALQSLCGWGNLDAHPDTADVTTVEEFYRPRFLYQITPRGEAVERALELYHETVVQPGELQTVALEDIRVLLVELGQLAAEDHPPRLSLPLW